MADGRHLEKCINCHISAISTKFSMLTHTGPPNPKRCSKNQFLKIQDDGWSTFWKKLNAISAAVSAAVWPIMMKFGMIMHLSYHNLTGIQKLKNFKRRRTAAILKIEKSRYLRKRLANFDKFCTMTYISLPELISWSKNETFKHPRWQTASILKNVKCDISATIWPRQWSSNRSSE